MAELRLKDTIARAMQEVIAESGENEVFFIGFPDDTGEITDFRVAARGNKHAVPAITNLLRPGDVVIHNHPSGELVPSDADLDVASRLGNMGIGVYITDNTVRSFYAVVEPQQKPKYIPLQVPVLRKILSPDGPIAQKLSNYEYRDGQIKMLDAIVTGFNEDKIVTVEAGTGTGKTLAYLIPAIYWALHNKERCVVSTNTINLQEQIIKKDVPFLKNVISDRFTAVLVKGRNNYLCLRKTEFEAREIGINWGSFSPEKESDAAPVEHIRKTMSLSLGNTVRDTEELAQIVRWAQGTPDGSLSDLSFQPQATVWERVQCEADTCTRMKCRYFEKCFLVRARREAASANLIVVNHHLLCADLSLRSETNSYSDLAILPPYHRIIIDEAHHFEEVATEYFGLGISRGGVSRMLSRIYSEKTRGESSGLLSVVRTKLILKNKGRLKSILSPLVQRIEETLIPAKNNLDSLNNELFEYLRMIIPPESGRENSERKLRLTPPVISQKQWSGEIIPRVNQIKRDLQQFIHALKEFRDEIYDLPAAVAEELEDVLVNLTAQIGRFDSIVETLHQIFSVDDEEQVKWIEIQERLRGTSISVYSAPLQVSEILEKALFQSFKTVVLTSATLAVGGDFKYLHHRLGIESLPPERRVEHIVLSPFDYPNQVIIGIPLDLPDPNERGFQEQVDDFLGRALLLSGGKAFVLYTSYKMLNQSYQKLEEPLKSVGILPLKQGTDTRTRLLDTFRRDISSVLFATDSFWEGVDVEGEALEVVIIVKLPFRVPTEPIIEARVEDIERKGGNAFYEYTVPQAVIKFKQGFGRLIRRKTDKGFVLILDKRVRSKPYGQIFLKSLPECCMVMGERTTVLEEVEKFFKKQ